MNTLTTQEAIKKADEMMSSWTEEELKQYAFDQLVDELCLYNRIDIDQGIKEANNTMASWTKEELKHFALRNLSREIWWKANPVKVASMIDEAIDEVLDEHGIIE